MAEDKNRTPDDKKLVPAQSQLLKKSDGQAVAKKKEKKVYGDDDEVNLLTDEFDTNDDDGGVVNGIDTGLACLVAIAKYYNIPADYRQLERAYVLSEGSVDFTTLVRAARELKLKARKYEGLTEPDLENLFILS